MGYPFTLQQKPDPNDRQGPKKWYAVPRSGSPVSEKNMTRMATEDTTVADIELQAAAKLIGKWIHNQVIQGKRVKIPGLGTFRITFGSEGTEDITQFHTGMIRNVKLSYIPDADLRADILQDLTFENAGVIDGDTFYGSLDNYKEVKGLKSPSGGGSQTGGTGGSGEDEEGSFG